MMRPPPRSQSYWSRRPATWPAAPCTAAAPASSTTSRLVAAASIQTPSRKLLPIYQNSQSQNTNSWASRLSNLFFFFNFSPHCSCLQQDRATAAGNDDPPQASPGKTPISVAIYRDWKKVAQIQVPKIEVLISVSVLRLRPCEWTDSPEFRPGPQIDIPNRDRKKPFRALAAFSKKFLF